MENRTIFLLPQAEQPNKQIPQDFDSAYDAFIGSSSTEEIEILLIDLAKRFYNAGYYAGQQTSL